VRRISHLTNARAARDTVVRELKAAQRGYLEPIFNAQRLKD